jgi:predicted nucleic acid-binding protein
LYLIDTDTLSQLAKKRPSPRLLERLRMEPADALYTSCVCVMELRYGARRRPDAELFWGRIQTQILSRVHVAPLGDREAVIAGDVLAELSSRGTPIGVEDVLIGATALANGLTLVTGNLRHFARIPGLRVESWL